MLVPDKVVDQDENCQIAMISPQIAAQERMEACSYRMR